MLLPPEPSASPTPAPSITPTKGPSGSPSASPTENPTADLPDDGSLVTDILDGASATQFGCANDAKTWKAIDGTTKKFWCDRTGMHNISTGIIFIPNHGQLTIPKALRLYPANGCKTCDPKDFILEGRTNSTGPWVEIETAVLPSIDGRNPHGTPVDASTYANADPNLASTEVHFHGHSIPYLDYKLTVVTKSPGSNTLQVGEFEMPGMMLPAV
jgi:hypothetical protein